MKRLFYILILWSISLGSFGQKDVTVDQAKLAQAKASIDAALTMKDKTKQSEQLNKALDYFREVKMIKDGYLYIGDGFYNQGDLTNASRWYSKSGKENREATSTKLGETYLEDAMKIRDNEKDQAKAIQKAYKYLAKAYGPNEANRQIGNEFFNLGKDYYPKALDYYQKGSYSDGIFMIADLYATKDETKGKAAETYASAKTRDGYKKAGDIYYASGDFVRSMEYYVKGGVVEGYIKYAGELKKAGKTDMYNRVCDIIADSLISQGKKSDVTTMATQAEKEKNYSLAADLYTKLGDEKNATKYSAYKAMSEMDFIKAKEDFQKAGRTDMVEDIDRNSTQLTQLQQIDLTMQELIKSLPPINTKMNPNTGKLEYDQNDIKLRGEFYKNPANQKTISDAVYGISEEFRKLNSGTEMKEIVKQHFLQYNPVKNILDSYNLSKKVMPANINAAAVTF